MALVPLLQRPELNESQKALRSRFFEETGYGAHDILSISYSTGFVLTMNGGKYRITEDTVEYVQGPPVSVEDRFDL